MSRPVELAKATGQVGWQPRRGAVDSSPLRGAGRVADPGKVLGRALPQVGVLGSGVLGLAPEASSAPAGGPWWGHARGPAALDGEGAAPQARHAAWQRLVDEAAALVRGGHPHSGAATPERPWGRAWAARTRSRPQALAPAPAGRGQQLVRGTARARLPAWGERARRHGRTSPAPPLTGDQRPGLPLLDAHRVVEAVAQPANQPAPEALEQGWPALEAHGEPVSLAMARAYLRSPWMGPLQAPGLSLLATPWPVRKRGRLTQEPLQLQLERQEVTGPAGGTGRLTGSGRRAQCPAAPGGRCAWQAEGTPSTPGRTRSMPPQAALWSEWRASRRTAEGRMALRQRTGGEQT